jgi:hypothetical protein
MLPAASRNRHDNSTINTDIRVRAQAACGRTLTFGEDTGSSVKWFSTGVVVALLLAGCESDLVEKDLGMRIPSPSGKYILTVSESAPPNEQPQLSLGLRNAGGNALDVFRTDVPASMKWAVGWSPGEDVVVLYSEKVTWVYIISSDKLRTMECPQQRYGDIGRELRRLKYEVSEGRAQPPLSPDGQ